MDTLTGASTNDTIIARESNDVDVDTLTTGDNITGGAGTDTLTIQVSGTAGQNTAGVVTSGVEAVSVFNNSAGAVTVDAALMAGTSDLYINGGISLRDTTFTGVDSLPNLHLLSTNANATVTIADTNAAATGTADEAVILSNNSAQISDVTATYDGIEVINFVAAGTTGKYSIAGVFTGTNRALTLAGADLEKVVVTGDASANLNVNLAGAALDTQTAEFDASAAGGSITAHITKGLSEAAAVTMSAQADHLDFNGALSDTITLDGGDGIDTLELDTTLAYDEDLVAQAGAGVSNFEAIYLAAGNGVDERALPNNAGVTTVISTAGGSYTKATGLASLTQLSTGTFTASLATDGAADALSLTLAGGVTSTLVAADMESLTVASGGSAANSVTMSAIGSADLTSVTAAGTQDLTLTISGTKLATVDASGIVGTGSAFVLSATGSTADMTVTPTSARPADVDNDDANDITTGAGDDTLTGGAYNDSLSGGAGDDTISGGEGDNTLTGGAGDDTITAGSGDDSISDGAGDDTVTSGAGDDTITLGAGSDTVDAGAGDDTIVAGANLTSGDDIDGGAGTDALTATVSGVGIAPTIAGVESISLGFGASTYVDMADVTGATSIVVDSATTGGAAAELKNLATGATITLTDEATLAGTGNITSLTVDTAADASVGVKIAANAAAATPAATSITGLTFTDAASVSITNVGGTVDNVLDHQITGNVVLDDTDTTSLSLATSAYGSLNFVANNVTSSSALSSFTASAASYGDITLGTIADAEDLQTISISAAGTDADVTIGNIGVGGTASTALASVSLTATAGGEVDTGAITAAANMSTVTISADGTDSDVTPGGALTTGNGGISSVSISASDRGNVDMSAGDLTVGSGLIGALSVSATGRATIDLTDFVAASTAATTAGAYSLTTGTRGTITVADAIISTDGAMTSLTVTVGEDSTMAFGSGTVTAAGAIGTTTITVAADATTSGALAVGETTTDYTAASINLSADATNGGDINLDGDVATSLTVTLDGSATIAVASGVVNFDTNTDAIDWSSVTTVTSLVFNVGSSSGTNTLNFAANAAKVTVTGGSGVDTITGTAGADTISGGAGADVIAAGAGADTITTGTGADVITIGATDSLNTALDKITDYTAGTDDLDLVTIPLTLVAAGAAGNASAADLVAAADYVSSGATAATLAADIAAVVALQGTGAFDDVGDTIVVTLTGASVAGTGITYVIQNQAADATYDAAADTVIALTGTSTAPTVLADFI